MTAEDKRKLQNLIDEGNGLAIAVNNMSEEIINIRVNRQSKLSQIKRLNDTKLREACLICNSPEDWEEYDKMNKQSAQVDFEAIR